LRQRGPSGPDHALIANPGQDRLEGNARQLQRGTFEVDHVAIDRALHRQRDHVGAEQRPESRIGIVALGRNLDVDAVAFVPVAADECEAGIAAAKLALWA
jgi:hypothetical protein